MARAFVYMLVNYKGGAIYTGLTKDLPSRVHDHKIKRDPKSFTAEHNIHRLVWFEDFDNINEAIATEKRMKGWRRAWKINTIEAANPNWQELDPITGGFK